MVTQASKALRRTRDAALALGLAGLALTVGCTGTAPSGSGGVAVAWPETTTVQPSADLQPAPAEAQAGDGTLAVVPWYAARNDAVRFTTAGRVTPVSEQVVVWTTDRQSQGTRWSSDYTTTTTFRRRAYVVSP